MDRQYEFQLEWQYITTQVVFDAKGLFAELPTASIGKVYDATTCTVSGACALPGSNSSLKKGSFPIGPVPFATSTFNTQGQIGVPTTLNDLILGADDNIGGSPMDNGPFGGANANFDFSTLTVTGYNDTTAPAVSLSTTAISALVGDAFDINAPTGVTITCLDAADGTDNITSPAATNPNISFAVTNGDGVPADAISVVGGNIAGAGVFKIAYTCSDNASARAAIADDPNNSGNATLPTDNASPKQVLTVTVNTAGQPTISITGNNPETLEACTTYTDGGATFSDPEDGGPFTIPGSALAPGGTQNNVPGVSTLLDATPIIGAGNEPNEGLYSIVYNAVDSTGVAALTQTRKVNVTDTKGPVISIPGGAAVTIQTTDQATYTNPVATAVDANNNCNAVVGGGATTSDAVNFVVPDGSDSLDTTLQYFASDSATAPNQTQTNQVVTVQRSEPVISLLDVNGAVGGGGIVLDVDGVYTEFGIKIHDVQDGDVNNVITSGADFTTGISYTITNNIDVTTPGNYTVTYTATDSNGNPATVVTRAVQVGIFASASNFTMLDGQGNVFGGTNDVTFDWDLSTNNDQVDYTNNLNFNMIIASQGPFPFFGFPWTAHDTRVFGPGTYSFDTGCTVAEIHATGCPAGSAANSGAALTMTVGPGQIGAHILFDWNVTSNIDVVNVWNVDGVWDIHGATGAKNKLWDGTAGQAPDPSTTWKLVSTDVNGDGINASPMVDGPFGGFYANFNAGPGGTAAPAPPYDGTAPDTKIGSGAASLNLLGLFSVLVTLLGFRRFTKQ